MYFCTIQESKEASLGRTCSWRDSCPRHMKSIFCEEVPQGLFALDCLLLSSQVHSLRSGQNVGDCSEQDTWKDVFMAWRLSSSSEEDFVLNSFCGADSPAGLSSYPIKIDRIRFCWPASTRGGERPPEKTCSWRDGCPRQSRSRCL